MSTDPLANVFARARGRSKLILEEVMAVAKGKLTIIAHVACNNNTKDSVELARHAEELGVDTSATIPRRSISACQNTVWPTTGMKSV